MSITIETKAKSAMLRGLPCRVFDGGEEFVVDAAGSLHEGDSYGTATGKPGLAGSVGPVAQIEVDGVEYDIAAKVTSRPATPVHATGPTRRPAFQRCSCGQVMTAGHSEVCADFSGGY